MTDTPWVVCGWFTPGYRLSADKLIASLDAIGAPLDIAEVPKLPGTWEDNTMAKPAQLLAAMDRHAGKVVMFLDVDCEVLGDLSPLASITGDVGLLFYVRTKFRRSGGMRFGARSGIVVVRPTPVAGWSGGCTFRSGTTYLRAGNRRTHGPLTANRTTPDAHQI